MLLAVFFQGGGSCLGFLIMFNEWIVCGGPWSERFPLFQAAADGLVDPDPHIVKGLAPEL